MPVDRPFCVVSVHRLPWLDYKKKEATDKSSMLPIGILNAGNSEQNVSLDELDLFDVTRKWTRC